jgi:hypothetical protein
MAKASRRREEEWARRVVERELGQAVEVHDDGSTSGMFDLRVGAAGSEQLAIEVTGAVDPDWTETWSVGQQQPTEIPGVDGRWLVGRR